MANKVLVTAALPYANGSIHLGHMLEAVQTDIYVRARKLAGDDVIYMWSDDTHGTPIQLRARKEGIAPEVLIERMHAEHMADYRDFGIGFDIFYSTHSDEARHHAEEIFRRMDARGDIVARDVEQLYCDTDQMFLPDRFVRGTCPKCKAPDQYGDSCEVCSSTYEPTDLTDPRCATCGNVPALRQSEHLFVPLDRHEAFLRGWLAPPEAGGKTRLQEPVRNYVMQWVDGGLRDWDISRDGPYFGFEIPGHPGKFFYVWFDAPIGYIAATQRWCADNGVDFEQYWHNPGGDTEIVHVIGKDIVYFHCLFWPAMLHAASYTTPREVHVHGWLTVDGEKMSKSRGTFILARKFLELLPADALRYYFGAKLSAGQDDIDLSIEDFVNRVNADLVKKAANLASRCGKFLHDRLGGTLGAIPAEAEPLLARAAERLAEARGLYLRFEYARASRLAMEVAEDFNVYITEAAPWKLAKSEPDRARGVLAAGLHACKIVATILKPILPAWAERTESSMRLPEPLSFQNGAAPLPEGHQVGPYETLFEPITVEAFESLIEASKDELAVTGAASAPAYEVPEVAPEISIDEFGAVDLRVGRVAQAARVEGASKLLRIVADLGPLGTRTVFAGIAKSFAPEDLVGKQVAVCVNLKPRKMRFGVSEGMVLASGPSEDSLALLEVGANARPGERIR